MVKNLPKRVKEESENKHLLIYGVLAVTGSTGYLLFSSGIYEGNAKKVIGGLLIAGLGGLYGAYKEGYFSDNKKS